MATQVKVPDMGESVVEATVARWMKNEGDAVKAGEAVVELETDKVNLEVAAEKDGRVEPIEHPAGDDVKIGDVLSHRLKKRAQPRQNPRTNERARHRSTLHPRRPTGKKREGFAAEPTGNPPVPDRDKEDAPLHQSPNGWRAEQGIDLTAIAAPALADV